MNTYKNIFLYLQTFAFYKRFLLSFFILSNLILWIQNYSYFYELVRIGGDMMTAILSVYDVADTFDYNSLLLIIISTFLSSISISLFLEYISTQSTGKTKQAGIIGSAIFLTTIMAQCMSCSTAILGTFISTSFLLYLPFGGLEISIVAILILLYNIYSLIKKINNPYVC